MKKYKVIKAIDIGNICYSPGIVAYEEIDIVKFLKENYLRKEQRAALTKLEAEL